MFSTGAISPSAGADLAPSATDPARGLFLSTTFHLAGDIQAEMKRFHYPHRFSPRSTGNLLVQDVARALVLGRLAVMDERLARGGPHAPGERFSLADAYLAYWMAWLGQAEACAGLPSLAALYRLASNRPRIGACLEATERMAEAYAGMMRSNPGGVIG